MERLRLSEVLRKLQNDGITITKRTFEFYQKLGLLPKPALKEKGAKGGVYGLYDSTVIDFIKDIQKLKDMGLTLTETTEKLEKRLFDKYKAVLQKWGFSDYSLPELRGHEYGSLYYRYLHKLMVHRHFIKQGPEDYVEAVAALKASDGKFQDEVKGRLSLFASDESIEADALYHISNAIYGAKFGLAIVLNELAEERAALSDAVARATLNKVMRRFMSVVRETSELRLRINARIAEIDEGSCKGRTKSVWESPLTLESEEREAVLEKLLNWGQDADDTSNKD
jgi:DNA-binding transcriptional MerR regulator